MRVKTVSLFLITFFMAGCLGGRMYFDKPTRYDIKLSMLKMKKHYEIVQQWVKGEGGTPEATTDSVARIRTETDFLLNKLPSRNPEIYQEKLRDMLHTLDFLEESVKDNQPKRAKYHFNELRGSCTSCHFRYKVGVNF
ncbi:MAG: hypothetical protein DRJ08_02495 [Acidobacteria bacterium]|nr:MAG: hypothetical protein DRJ14_00605 [Acidobacteriota bacterium]RLE23480.1 MAG: hypothetical protein DRJ08_02495 [Acidobacteriota bacterium]